MAKKAKVKKAKGKNGSRGMPPKTDNLLSAVDAQNRRLKRDKEVSRKSVIARR